MSTLSQKLKNFHLWRFNRFGKQATVPRKPHFVSVFDKNAGADLQSYVERMFAFSSASSRMAYSKASSDISSEAIIELAPTRMLFIDVTPNRHHIRVLKNMNIPYLIINSSMPDQDISHDVNAFAQRTGISEVVGRRNAIYVHKPTKRNLPIIVNAFLEAKRQYPDLLMMLSGAEVGEISALNLDLMVIEPDASKNKRQLGDILISSEGEFNPDWASAANLCILLPENKNIQQSANMALGSGASLLTYRVDLEAYDTLNDLEAIGAIWSAQNPKLLAAAITQALSPEKTALTVGQSLEHLTAREDHLSQAVDTLLDQD